MASEQLSRSENTTTEREIHIEKNRVPKMTTHFEHLAEQVKDSDGGNKQETPQGTIEALQGGEMNKEHAGTAIGDVGGRGKARETHEAGAHFESLADKVRGEREGGEHRESKEKGGERARSANIARDKESEAMMREREGGAGVRNVGMLEMQGGVGKEELEGRTREVRGRPQKSDVEKEGKRGSVGQVVAEKGGGRGRESKEEGAKVKDHEEKFEGRYGGVEREGAKARNEEENFKGRVGGGGEKEGATTAVLTCTYERGGGDDVKAGRERNEALEDRAATQEAKKNANEVFSDAQNGYEGAKQPATQEAKKNANEVFSDAQNGYEGAEQPASETLSSTTQTAQEKASQAKDAALEKGQQGHATTKDTLSNAAKTAPEYTAPVAEKAKDYTLQAAEKAKSAGGTTVNYVGDKAVQAKDVTVETGKSAAEYAGKVAADLKDKAAVAGWKAAHFSTDMTVEGTKAAANVVEGAAGYAGHKAAELAAKSVDAVKGLAASAGDTAKGYTARKKEEAERELQAKTGPQQEASQDVGETIGQYAQNVLPTGQSQRQEGTGSTVLSAIGETAGNVGEKIKKPFENITGRQSESSSQTSGGDKQQVQGKGSEAMTGVGETLGDVAQRVKQPLDSITGSITGGGTEVLGAVAETVGEIGETVIKPAERVQEQGQMGQGGAVLGAIGETIAEIAQTTKVMVGGEGESESRQNVGTGSLPTDHGRHE